ncbi:MAG: hypothetical protein K2X99_05505 [Gemmatimonadaceae bacterium]|nr:hypothetical protein [Gemmatimonadaceae bacterium]
MLLRHLAVIAALLPAVTRAQSENFSFHGSLNAGYGKSTNLPVIGIPTEGTADYRIVTLQARYKATDKDQFVVQLLNRRVGTSPLRNAIGDLTTQWAYWQRSAGDLTFKVGRAPLPRGLMNEVRYIGTVLPFFRVAYEYTYDAFDANDGVVVSYRKGLGDAFRFEGHVFGGGSENRNVRSEAAGLSVRVSRASNMRGAQFYLDAPAGIRLGLYGDSYDRIDDATNTHGMRNHHGFSAQMERQYVTVRAEHMRETGYGPMSDLRNTYANVIVKPTETWRFAVEQSIGDQLVFPTGQPSVKIPAVRSTGGAVNYLLSSNTVLKLEHHWRRGYQFDAFVPPTKTVNGAAVVQPSAYTNYWILSAAFSF